MAGKKRKRHTPEEIITKLRTIETALARGVELDMALREVQVSPPTFYRWKKQYGRMDRKQLKRLKDVEKENARLKKVVAELTLDKAILKEALEGK